MRGIVILIAMLLAASPAFTEEAGFYVGAKGILSVQNTGTIRNSHAFSNDPKIAEAGGFGVFTGWDFYPKTNIPIRTELEYAWRSQGNASWDPNGTAKDYGAEGSLDIHWNVQTLFANFYVDWHNDTSFTPYVDGGIGAAYISADGDWHVEHQTRRGKIGTHGDYEEAGVVPAWNIGAGVAWKIDDRVLLDASYRYMNASTFGHLDIDPSAHEFSLGLRLLF